VNTTKTINNVIEENMMGAEVGGKRSTSATWRTPWNSVRGFRHGMIGQPWGKEVQNGTTPEQNSLKPCPHWQL